MNYESEPMERLTKVAALASVVSLVAGLIPFFAGMAYGRWLMIGDVVVRSTWLGGLLRLGPGALLGLLAWRMSSGDSWAYVAITVISFALLARIALRLVIDLSGPRGLGPPVLAEGVGSAPCIYLVVGSLNAMPDVRAEARRRRRERQQGRRGFEPILAAAAVPPGLPPRPAGLSRRGPAAGRVPPTPPPPRA